jgi:hypothetical protein
VDGLLHLPLLFPLVASSLELNSIPKVGYQGPIAEPIFPVLTTIAIDNVREIQAPEDLFPALETIKWYNYTATPGKMARSRPS